MSPFHACFNSLFLCIYLAVSICARMFACLVLYQMLAQRTENSTKEHILPFDHVGLRNEHQRVRVGGKCLYLLCHLANLSSFLTRFYNLSIVFLLDLDLRQLILFKCYFWPCLIPHSKRSEAAISGATQSLFMPVSTRIPGSIFEAYKGIIQGIFIIQGYNNTRYFYDTRV